MPDQSERNVAIESEVSELDLSAASPLVFISHDSRDAKFAEAFSKLLKSVSSGMIKTFRSSDKSGTEGIEYGDEWYRYLMEKLAVTTDVVCLFTERSLERPWILYEAGVAKSKIDTKVMGLALGIPLSKVSSGPFYHFQNGDDTIEALTKLVHQFAKRYKGLDLDPDVVADRIKAFKETVATLLDEMGSNSTDDDSEENSIAKIAEEMKTLPSRVAERITEFGDPSRRKRRRRLHPMMLDEILQSAGMQGGDPVVILIAASLVRDDLPWLYEIAMETYHVLKSGRQTDMQREAIRLRRFNQEAVRMMMIIDQIAFPDDEMDIIARRLPHLLERILVDAVERKRTRFLKKPASDETEPDIEDEAS